MNESSGFHSGSSSVSITSDKRQRKEAYYSSFEDTKYHIIPSNDIRETVTSIKSDESIPFGVSPAKMTPFALSPISQTSNDRSSPDKISLSAILSPGTPFDRVLSSSSSPTVVIPYAPRPTKVSKKKQKVSFAQGSIYSINNNNNSSSSSPSLLPIMGFIGRIFSATSKLLNRILPCFFPCSRAWVLFIIFVISFMAAIYISIDMISQTIPPCQGSPYLYVTHKGAKNILKFSLDGCLLQSRVLWGNYDRSDLRGLVFGYRRGQPVLYVSDSNDVSSQILVFGDCSPMTGMRQLVGRVTSVDVNEAAKHPYSLSVDEYGNIYGTFQNTDVLLRFRKDSFLPMESPPMLIETCKRVKKLMKAHKNSDNGNNYDNDTIPNYSVSTDINDYYPGTFLQFGNIGDHSHHDQGIRSVAYVRGRGLVTNTSKVKSYEMISDQRSDKSSIKNIRLRSDRTYRMDMTLKSNHSSSDGNHSLSPILSSRQPTVWVSNRNLDAILVLDANSGNLTSVITLADPIGLSVNYHYNVMFAGSKASKQAAVVAIDLDSLQIIRKYTLLSMKHPTGIVSKGEELIIADQEANAIWSFNITSGRYLRLVVSSEKLEKLEAGELELMSLSVC